LVVEETVVELTIAPDEKPEIVVPPEPPSATESDKKKPVERVKHVAPAPEPEPPAKSAGAIKSRRKEKAQKGKGKKRF
jgi:hypothetical protein